MPKYENFKYGIYIKTYNRIHLLSRCLANVLEFTSFKSNDQLVVVCDDKKSADWIRENYPIEIKRNILSIDDEGENRGSNGTYAAAVSHSIEQGNDFTIVFEDDCWPYRSGWLEVIDDFMKQSKKEFKLLNFCVTKPYSGIYENQGLSIVDQKGVAVIAKKGIGEYLIQGMNIDSFVMSCIANELFDDESHIIHPWFEKYGYWHSQLQLKFWHKGKIPWRTGVLKQLELYIYACDFLKKEYEAVTTGGLSRDEKTKSALRNKDWSEHVKWTRGHWKSNLK